MNTCKISQNAEQFVNDLFTESILIACDETNDTFLNNNYPYFYNQENFKRGQTFFHNNFASMLYGMLVSLVIGLTEPKLNFILQHTQMSNTPKTAFKRYKSTIKHILLWYESDFKPRSQSWKSLQLVKLKHNYSSKSVARKFNIRISQWDMAIVQFGFVFPVLLIGEEIGISNMCEEDLHGFLHIWRNFGYILGIEDRFNICKESIQETKLICESIMKQHILPLYIKNRNSKHYIKMTDALLQGMKLFIPAIHPHFWLTISKNIMLKYADEKVKFTTKEENYIKMQYLIMNLLNIPLFRLFFNYMCKIIIWLAFQYSLMSKLLKCN